MSELEDLLAFQIRANGLPEPRREYAAVSGRKFRFDFAWPNFKLLLEVQGGTWIKGGHSTGKGIGRDCEKECLALAEGWRVAHVDGDQVRAGKAVLWIEAILWRAA